RLVVVDSQPSYELRRILGALIQALKERFSLALRLRFGNDQKSRLALALQDPARQLDNRKSRKARRRRGQLPDESVAGRFLGIVLVYERTDKVEDGAKNVLRSLVRHTFPDRLSVGPKLLVEAVDVDDKPKSSERAMSEFVRVNPKMPIVDVDEPAQD